MTTLITFLGRTPKSDKGYQTTRYRFEGEELSEPIALFGWLLQRRIAAQRLVILGTSGSMWDHLFEIDLELGSQAEQQRLELMTAVDNKQVEQQQLDPMQDMLSTCLDCAVCLVLIPYCHTDSEQVELLRIMANQVRVNEHVHLDVTHGFRHLPMLAVLSAMHLQLTKHVVIEDIWYAVYDPDTRQAPVWKLKGLLHIAEWIQALSTYDKDSDYSVFAPLLGESGNFLKKAAYFERTSNTDQARQAITSWATSSQPFPSEDPAANLFANELKTRIAWYKKDKRAQHEQVLAKRYLQQRDYLRASIFALEACVSGQVGINKQKQHHYRDREKAKLQLSQNLNFKQLKDIRNALAHGVRSNNDAIGKILADETILRETLDGLFATLLMEEKNQ